MNAWLWTDFAGTLADFHRQALVLVLTTQGWIAEPSNDLAELINDPDCHPYDLRKVGDDLGLYWARIASDNDLKKIVLWIIGVGRTCRQASFRKAAEELKPVIAWRRAERFYANLEAKKRAERGNWRKEGF